MVEGRSATEMRGSHDMESQSDTGRIKLLREILLVTTSTVVVLWAD